VDDIMTLAHVR